MSDFSHGLRESASTCAGYAVQRSLEQAADRIDVLEQALRDIATPYKYVDIDGIRRIAHRALDYLP